MIKCKEVLKKWLKTKPKKRSLQTIDENIDEVFHGLDYCHKCQRYGTHCYCLFEPHSGAIGAVVSTTSTKDKVENVVFSDQHVVYEESVPSFYDETRLHQDMSDALLENFFTRPLKIHEAEWGTGTSLYFQIDPWSLYFQNPRVANRIANYNLLRCNLHIKIVINGNGFQYGRAIASYLPMEVYDSLSVNASLIPETITQASQQPHIFLNPTMSTGGEMVLPFFNFWNYISIPESEWEIMGKLTVRSINALKHANGATDQVTISVFAWAEDVSLSVLTSRESTTLSPQSGEIDEANQKGFVSGPATAIANVADQLAVVPWLKPYAMATSAVSSSIANIAKVFGYSRPPQTQNSIPYRPTNISSLAACTVPDTVEKLTVDDKQELSIDPRISGIDTPDPLAILNIAKRESYLTTFSWNIGTAPETLLWNARVTPVTWSESGLTPAFHFPACAMAALPFEYWTGTMNFRFQIVCSSFHKGRMKVVYDPNWLASNEYNTNYLKIVDIADTTDFSVSISNGQERTLLEHHYPGVDSVTQLYSTTAYTSKEAGNGVIGVYVVNELTTPNSTVTNDIEINVYVSAGDDFEVFVPEDHFQRFVCKPQSGIEVPDSENSAERDKPTHDDQQQLGPSLDPLTNIHKVYTGECVKSFRQVLKRYNLHSAIGTLDTVAVTTYARRSIFPFLRGNVANAVHTTAALAPYNYCNTVLLHWVTWAFSGWRGSIRYKVLHQGGLDADTTPSVIYVDREPASGIADFQDSSTTTATYSTVKAAAATVVAATPLSANWRYNPPTGPKGSAYRISTTNPSLEFETPFYAKFRFSPGKTEDWTSSTFTNRLQLERFNLRWQCNGNSASLLTIHVAAGEDYQPYFFTGLPPLYYEADPPL